jgi:hypothetical protein
MEPDDYHGAPVSRILRAAVEGLKQRGMHNRSLQVAIEGPTVRPIPYVQVELCTELKKKKYIYTCTYIYFNSVHIHKHTRTRDQK